MMTGWSLGDKGLPASCCSKPAGMNMGECVPARTGPFSTGTRCARLERGRRSVSPCREEEDWVSNLPGHSMRRGRHIFTVPMGSTCEYSEPAHAWHYPRNPRPKAKGFPCPVGTLCPVLGLPTTWLPTLALVVAGNPSVMAGREAALCRANWASELSCIIRRWARGVCTKHNSLVSCSSSGRAQRGTSSSGTGSRRGWLSPSCLAECLRPGQGASGTHGDSTYARRQEMHTVKEDSVSEAALGQAEVSTVQGKQG